MSVRGKIEDSRKRTASPSAPVIEVAGGRPDLDTACVAPFARLLVEMLQPRPTTALHRSRDRAKIIEPDKNRNNVVLSAAHGSLGSNESASNFLHTCRSASALQRRFSIVNFGSVCRSRWCRRPTVSELSWKHITPVRGQRGLARKSPSRFSTSITGSRARPRPSRPRKIQAGLRPHPRHRPVEPGKVSQAVPGAFVRVEDGIEGLVHISELPVTSSCRTRPSRSAKRSSPGVDIDSSVAASPVPSSRPTRWDPKLREEFTAFTAWPPSTTRTAPQVF